MSASKVIRVAQETGKPNESEEDELRAIFFHYDDMLHNRVNMLLVAQSLMFAGAANVWREFPFILTLGIAAVLFALVFTFTTVKLYWRVRCDLRRFAGTNRMMQEHLEIQGFEATEFSPVDRLLRPLLHEQQSWCLDSGFWFTWGLLGLIVLAWCALCIASAVSR